MIGALGLMKERRFLPLFVTQFLGAFNDNLFKNAMIFFATYQIFNSVEQETQFSAIATGIFILPFFLFSALAGQLADTYDKAKIMRIIKAAEVVIMLVGALGIFVKSLPLMLVALVGMATQPMMVNPSLTRACMTQGGCQSRARCRTLHPAPSPFPPAVRCAAPSPSQATNRSAIAR